MKHRAPPARRLASGLCGLAGLAAFAPATAQAPLPAPTPAVEAPPTGGYTQLTWKELTEQGHVIAGSPETVRQRMEDLIKGLNVGNIFCLMHVGNMPADKCMYSTKLFAEKVMPKLRNMFPDWEDDNRFWTTPLDKRVTAGRLPKQAPTSADLAKTYALEA